MIISKQQLVNNIVTELSDNSTGQISPYDIRHNLLDIVDSVHILLQGKDLDTNNFASLDTRVTKAGKETLKNYYVTNSDNEDNSAFGYSSLRNNFQGTKNTAIGSSALSCNVYGGDNVAVGYKAVSANTTGYGNVGLGNYTIESNKFGNYNIGIGHGAGYYIGRNDSYRLYIAAHPVDSGYICQNPVGSGLTPLVFGDLENLKFGIAVSGLHNDGTLQVSGNITPSQNAEFNLGSNSYQFNKLYLSSGITFPSGDIGYSYSLGAISTSGDILPVNTNTYNFGSTNNRWNVGYFKEVIADSYTAISKIVSDCHYDCKTLYLASSGICESNSPCGYLSSEEIEDAGLFIRASGIDYTSVISPAYFGTTIFSSGQITATDTGVYYTSNPFNSSNTNVIDFTKTYEIGEEIISYKYLRDYYFQLKGTSNDATGWYKTPASSFTTPFSNARWETNVSLHVDGTGCYIKTPNIYDLDRIIGDYNIYLHEDYTYLHHNRHNNTSYVMNIPRIGFSSNGGLISNSSSDKLGNILFIESNIDITSTLGVYLPGHNVSQRFLTGIQNTSYDTLNNNLPKLKGFELKYYDDLYLDYEGPQTDRFTINSYNSTSEPVRSLVFMKGGKDPLLLRDTPEGIFGINNFGPTSDLKVPETALNIRTTENAIIRATAESDGYYQSSLQLFGHENCINSGVEFTYYNHSGIADISMYKDSGNEIFIRMDEDGKIGFFAVSGQMDDMITIGGSGHSQAVVSINETIGSVSSTEKYGKIYVKEKIVGETQSASLYFLDSSGNLFDVILSKYNNDDNLVYSDTNRNTLAGDTNYDREILTKFDAYDNTAFGYYALRLLSSGDKNVAIGSFAADSISSGDANIAIGYGAMQGCTNNISNNIVIGNNFVGRQLDTSDTLLVGNGSYPLISGNLNSSNRHLFLPDGNLSLESNDGEERLVVKNNVIEIVDGGGDDYPQNQLTFKFTGNETADLLTLKHSGEPLSNTPEYEFADSGIPYAELKGDFRLQNAIRFSDGTSLYSSSGIAYTSQIDALVVEGIAQQTIAIGDFNTPVSGIIRTRNDGDLFIHNRDKFLQINTNDFVVAIKVGSEYRPLWVSSESTACQCCGN